MSRQIVSAPTQLEVMLDCSACGGPQLFLEPPCADGHQPCPELACVACGSALLLGWSALLDFAEIEAPAEVEFARSA